MNFKEKRQLKKKYKKYLLGFELMERTVKCSKKTLDKYEKNLSKEKEGYTEQEYKKMLQKHEKLVDELIEIRKKISELLLII